MSQTTFFGEDQARLADQRWNDHLNNLQPSPAPPAAPPAPTPPPASPLAGGSAASGPQADARAQIQTYLGQYGLSELGDFAYNEYISGVPLTQIFLDIRGTDTYKQRFPAMAGLGQRGHAISEGTYVSLEQQYASILRQAGLPRGFYDSPADFTNWIGGEVSPTEIAQRVQDGYLKVSMAPPEVRAAFSHYFGADGDQALAAFFLDPNKAAPQLIQMADAAIVGGTAMRFGFDLNTNEATTLAQMGVGAKEAQTGFQHITEIAPLFHETLGEQHDFTAGKEGVAAAFGTDATSALAIEQRRQERAAQFQKGQIGGPGIDSMGSSIGSATSH